MTKWMIWKEFLGPEEADVASSMMASEKQRRFFISRKLHRVAATLVSVMWIIPLSWIHEEVELHNRVYFVQCRSH